MMIITIVIGERQKSTRFTDGHGYFWRASNGGGGRLLIIRTRMAYICRRPTAVGSADGGALT
jgi:hypothetical protein